MRFAFARSYADAMTTGTIGDDGAAAGRGVSWGVFLVVVVGVLCTGVALGFGVSERAPGQNDDR